MNLPQMRLQRIGPILRRQDHRRLAESRQRRRPGHGRTSPPRNKHFKVNLIL